MRYEKVPYKVTFGENDLWGLSFSIYLLGSVLDLSLMGPQSTFNLQDYFSFSKNIISVCMVLASKSTPKIQNHKVQRV